MKRIAPTILGTLLAASVTTALGAPQGQMEVYVKRSKIEVIDIGAPGPSVGDISITTGPISKTNGGEPIGSYITRRITVVANQPGKTEADVMQELRLPEGTILVSSILSLTALAPTPEREQVRAIIGGTGKYAGARGESMLRVLDSDTRLITFHFE